MAPRKLPQAAIDNDRPYNLKLYHGQLLRLDAVKHRTGVPVPEQVRRAIEQWLEKYEHSRERERA